ncbi:type IV pilin [Halorubellus sp. JP-L1]|uniref:type IV pilin n=1 Tax=Halorubellus sp. JP-L1 TaxID=2715753 RepID=UPI00140DA248|nr:type IV pilin N-terminal domain-containing protein [Halorubellus sp. JP-L1]NHN41234.1 type IV pilin [Halorubellus sp. JP-L1]
MDLKNLLTDEEAVSPVIGVILMVAITVILAAVIGAFVLGIGGSQEKTPQASWDYNTETSPNHAWIQVNHKGGDEINTDQLAVNVAGSTAWDGGSAQSGWTLDDGASGNTTGFSGSATAGDTLSIKDDDGGVSDGNSITLIWSAPGSDQTSIIGEGEVQR